ncbi:MAG: HipA domain-containing protein [Bdellovibrionales bacterium]|nr:HipA domain-containing protein [Bdellovibrionales bacterium]
MAKCLACYEPLENAQNEYHDKCSRRIFGTNVSPRLDFTLNQVNKLASQVIQKRIAIPGVQPKLSLTYDSQKTGDKRLTIVGLWEGLYVLKPPNEEYPELPQNEDVTMHMAELLGIKVAKHSLIRFDSGELAYLSVRFDRKISRKKVVKIHQEDMCQLTGLLTEDKYNSSLEKVATAVNTYTTNKGLELLELFKVTVFSFLTGNSDMHLKNYSLVYKYDEMVRLSPAYDLLATKLVVLKDKEETALTLGGKKNRLNRQDFHNFAKYCQMNPKATDNVFTAFESKLSEISKLISKSFLSDEMAQQYLDLIHDRAERLNLSLPQNFKILDRR